MALWLVTHLDCDALFAGKFRMVFMLKKKKRRTELPTPKGEASNSLEHAKGRLDDLRRLTQSGQQSRFVHTFNDFLRAAQTVDAFLKKEPRGAGYKQFIKDELTRLESVEQRFKFLGTLRNVSSQDLNVRPSRSHISLQFGETLHLIGFFSR